MSNIYKGKLKFYKRSAGFGYIEYFDDGEKKSIYTHVSQFKGGVQSVRTGRIYKFTVGQNERGAIAQNVEVIQDAETEKDTRRESK